MQFYHLNSGGHTFIGSNDAKSIAYPGWDGDSIRGGDGNDIIRARGGDDWISASGGNDRIDGGAGKVDIVTYEGMSSDGRIVANLNKGRVTNADGKVDLLTNVEGIRGTNKNDKLIGSGASGERFDGMQGNDFIDGGGGGDDWARYHRDTARGGTEGVNANLVKGVIFDGFGDKDTVKGIENVRGSDLGDTFRDNAKANGFEGRDGNDTFFFGRGDDWANGGRGADKFIFKGAFGYDWISDFSRTDGDKIKIVGASKYKDLSFGESSKGNAQVKFGGNTVELDGWSDGDLQASDFIF